MVELPGRSAGRVRRVVVIDGSAVVRRALVEVLNAESDIAVVGQAASGAAGLDLIHRSEPDCLVLGFQTSTVSGQQVLRALEAEGRKLPVMVMSAVDNDDRVSLAAELRHYGATLVSTPSGADGSTRRRLQQTLVPQLRKRLGSLPAPGPHGAPQTQAGAPRPGREPGAVRAVVMAASTGGPVALERVLVSLGPPAVPVLVVQHISGEFSERLAARLNAECGFPVLEAADGEVAEAGKAYLSPGGRHLYLEGLGRRLTLRLTDQAPVNSCRPSADVLFTSAADELGSQTLAVVLTGIGHDGRDGCRSLVARGATVLAQDEPSSAVWGMPGSVVKAGLATEELALDAIGPRIRDILDRSAR